MALHRSAGTVLNVLTGCSLVAFALVSPGEFWPFRESPHENRRISTLTRIS